MIRCLICAVGLLLAAAPAFAGDVPAAAPPDPAAQRLANDWSAFSGGMQAAGAAQANVGRDVQALIDAARREKAARDEMESRLKWVLDHWVPK